MTRPNGRTDLDVLVDEIIWYTTRLHGFLPDPTQRGASDQPTGGSRVSGSPAPWNDEAAGVLFDIHAGSRWHVETLLLVLFQRRVTLGGSDEVTYQALRRLPRLITAAGRVTAARAADSDLHTWARVARRVLDDDPHPGEEHLQTAPGGLVCPYCERPLVLRPGWQYAISPAVWCLGCLDPEGVDELGHRAWEAAVWLGSLQAQTRAQAAGRVRPGYSGSGRA